MDNSILIGDKNYSEEEVIEKGKAKVKKIKNILRWVGLGVFLFSILLIASGLSAQESDGQKIGVIVSFIIMFSAPGIVSFVLSFLIYKKPDYIKIGKEAICKKTNTNFKDNKNIILQDAKKVTLNVEQKSFALIDFVNSKVQFFYKKKYSDIFSKEQIISFEIKENNVVLTTETSKSKTKKGAGKAIAGGLLLGGAGAIAGSMSGNGKTKSTSNTIQKESIEYTLLVKTKNIDWPSIVCELDGLQTATNIELLLNTLLNTNE